MKKITLLLLLLFASVGAFSQGLPLEGFESTSGPDASPATLWTLGTGDWAVFDNDAATGLTTAQRWGINTTVSTPPQVYQGTNSAYVRNENIGAGHTSEDYLATPLVTVPNNGQLHFYTRTFTSGNQGTIYQIKIAPALDPSFQTDPTAYTLVQQWTETELTATYNIYEEKIVDLSAYANLDVYISFVMVYTQPDGNLGGDRWLVDNVSVAEQCFAPTAPIAGSITLTSANLSWTGSAAQYEVEIIPQAGTFTGTGTIVSTNSFAATQTTALVPFTASTTYSYRVRAICSGGVNSVWVGPTNFTTSSPGLSCAAPIIVGGLPYSVTANTSSYADNTDVPQPAACAGTAVNYMAGNEVFYSYTPTANGTISITMTPTTANSSVFVYSGCANVGVTCLGGVANTGTGVRTLPNIPVVAGQQYIIVVSSSAVSQTVGFTLVIQAVACAQPATLAATGISQTGATLSWAAGAATSWQIAVQLATAPIPTSGTITTNNTAYPASGLTPNTNYVFYVRADCNDGNYSAWTGPFAFRTLCDAFPVPFQEGFNSTSTTENCWTVTNANGDTDAWDMNYTTTPFEGDQSAMMYTDFNAGANDDWLISPQIILNGNQRLRYRYKVQSAGEPNDFSVMLSTAGTSTADFTTTLVPSASYSNTTYAENIVNLSAYSGPVNIAWHVPAGGLDGWRLYIDNVIIENLPTCPEPSTLANNSVLATSANITWVPGNAETAWQVLYLPCGSPAPLAGATGWVDALTTNFPLTGLTPTTCYDVYVRAKCSDTELSPWVGPTTFTTQVAPPACGGTFVDNGGSAANYNNSSDSTVTICPTTIGDVVTVTFTTFNTEATWDALYVFDGNSIGAPQIASANGAGNVPGGLTGGYWGNLTGANIPGPFTSTSADGCLTFRFRSDASVNNPGWVANVTCASPATCRKPTLFSSNAVTYNSAELTWTQPINPDSSVATAWQVLYLPCGSPAPAADATGWIDANNNTAFPLLGLSPMTCYDVYVRAVCSPTDSSVITGPISFTTQVAPPVCGGNFVDAGGAANYPNSSDSTVTICPSTPGDTVTVTFTLFNTETNWDALYVFDGNSIGATQIASTNGAGNVPGGLAGGYWGNLTGANLPGPFTSSSPDGCLTFRFRSDASVNNPGWLANVTCAPAPNCVKPNTLTATNITSTSALLGWNEPNANVTQWEVIYVPFGSPAPLPGDIGTMVYANPALFTGLIPATQYTFYVRGICPAGGTSAWSSGFNFTTLIINDDCDGALFAPVNSSAVCQQITPGTLTGATASAIALNAPCVGTADDDVWFQFVATNPYLNVSLQNITGTTTNLNFAAYSGACGTLTPLFCSAANAVSGVLNGLTIGETYYIRVYSNASTPQTVNFNLCISTPSTCPTASTVCSLTDYANTTGVANLGTIGCLFTSPNPAYFTIQIATTGPVNFTLTQSTQPSVGGVPGTPNLDVDYAAWGPFATQDEACAFIGSTTPFAAPGIGVPVTQTTGCSYSAAPTETLNIANAQAGQLYIILITNFSNQSGYISLSQNNTADTGHGTTLCCPDAYFTYTPTSYCKDPSTPNPVPVIAAGSVAGVFSSTIVPGLVFVDTATGEVDLQNSAPGNYVITNTVAATATCVEKVKSFTINITAPTTATISYDSALYCKSISTPQGVTVTGTTGGTFSATPNGGLYIDADTGAITPSLSAPGVYTVIYSLPGSGVCAGANPTFTVEIAPLPNIIQPDPVVVCNSYTLPELTVGNYYDAPGGTGNQLSAGTVITSSQTVYIYAVSAVGCINEKSFTITINSVATPTVDITQATCASPTGTITVTSPVSTTGTPPSNLFISEVTDESAGSLTYVEIYNGTGAAVNLSGYKLKVYNNGGTSPSCNNQLAGIVNNNSTFVVAVGSTTNMGGVVPNQVFAGCGGVNFDDNIRLTTSADVEIDLWGRTDGTAFTPAGQPGYTYRRLASAPHPSMTWNPADWTALDPQDYTNVGTYTYLTSNLEYSLDTNPYQSGTVFTGVTPGDHTVTVHDVATGCYSSPITVTINLLGQNPAVTTIAYPTPLCAISATNIVLPDTTATGFTTGGTYSVVPATGLTVNPTTGAIDLTGSVAGTYVITYSVPLNTTICQEASSSSFTVVVNPAVLATVGFTYSTPVCQIATPTTLSPVLATGFVTGGTFSSTTGLTIDSTTGVIDLATSTAGTYTVTYTVGANPSACQAANTATFVIVLTAATPAVVGFTYTTPVCQIAVGSLTPVLASGFTTGGTFSSTTGLVINGTTGVINVTNSTAGTYTVTYTAVANPTACVSANTGTFVVTINAATNPIVGFSYTTPVCPGSTINPMPIPVTGFVTGGQYTSTTGLSINSTTGEVNLANSTPGSYTITYSIPQDLVLCQNAATSTASLLISAPIVVDVTGDCQGSQFVLTANPVNASFDPTTASYAWENAAGDAIGTNAQTVVVAAPGVYSVTVTANGCSGTDNGSFDSVICQIQKGISINGDGKNDVFELSGFNVSQLSIFNRYGMKVYSKSHYTNEWKGQSDKGDELPDGTYYYVIERDNGESRTGWIYINRAQ
jgi:gliding motility-associated-like protein